MWSINRPYWGTHHARPPTLVSIPSGGPKRLWRRSDLDRGGFHGNNSDYVYIYIHTYIRTYIHTYIHTYMGSFQK